MIAVDLEKVLLAVCQGCNEEFSEEPCEPGCCRIRERIEKLPRVTLDNLRPKGWWLHRDNGIAYCSECDTDAVEDGTDFYPNCGADMRGGGEKCLD